MRIVSWNIELGQDVAQAALDIEHNDRLRRPDILLVQEMAPGSVAELADRLGLDYRFAAPATHTKTGDLFGNAILSPWPMGDVVEIPMPHTAAISGQPRAATSASVEVAGVEVVANSVHVETVLLGVRRRVAQVRSVANATLMDASPCVVGGDFNAASSRSLRSFDEPLHSVGFQRATDASMKSFRRFGRAFSLDHLYVRDLSVRSAGVEPGAIASDHQPVWAEVEIHTEVEADLGP